MNKKQIHHVWTKTRLIKTQYLLVLTIVCAGICLYSLRSNNEHMISLRNDVYAADKNGTDIQKPLQALQAYVISHMNTNLSTGNTSVYPPIQLEYTYERLVEEQANQAVGTNSQLYTDAQSYCQEQDPVDFSGHNRVPCIEQYVESHSSISSFDIPTSLYEFSFISPAWSPDLAGWSLVLTCLFGLLTIVSFAANRWLKSYVG
jgi:hypothetical protein